ncbi:MAG: phospholipase D-like domain-containing protein [Methanosarcinales archaeon]|jgi:phosphatidylserine/phosphatidylglycerophosphate/cardiolipin synthase-like enzyme|nr:phospholipase D-like domain-containing protein [Methanosarcinales archaeon]
MVKVLDTQNCSAELSNLVKTAKEKIILVSPYLQISPTLFNSLKDARSRKVEIILVYRDDKLEGKALDRLNEEKNKLGKIDINILALENLHAKCYLNESMAIITSMNLYQYSQENNYELGMLIKKEDDFGAYGSIYNEISGICRFAQQNKKSLTGAIFDSIKGAFSDLSKCYCIRCRNKIEDNIDRPLCNTCYESWARFKNENFAEKHCFGCGAPSKTTYSKPLCKDCYR